MMATTQEMSTANRSGEPISPISRVRAHASEGRERKSPIVSKNAGKKPRVSRASQGRGATGAEGGAEGGTGGTVDMSRPPCLARPRAGARCGSNFDQSLSILAAGSEGLDSGRGPPIVEVPRDGAGECSFGKARPARGRARGRADAGGGPTR